MPDVEAISSTSQCTVRGRVALWLQPLLPALLLVCAFVGLFVGLSGAPVPHQVPVAVVTDRGSAQQVAALNTSALRSRTVSDRSAGLLLLRGNDVDAVISSSLDGLHLDVAGAAGPTTTTGIEQAVSQAASELRQPLSVHDAVPLSRFDRRGLAVLFTGLGIALASSTFAQNLAGARRRPTWSQRMPVTGAFSTLSGVGAAFLAGPLTGALPGPLWPVALTLTLLSAAGALATQALAGWLGHAGYLAATVLFVGVGIPTSGGVVGADLLPVPARSVSALLPPGTAVRAIRGFCYFGGSHVALPLLTLIGWAAAGTALLWIRDGRGSMRVTQASYPLTAEATFKAKILARRVNARASAWAQPDRLKRSVAERLRTDRFVRRRTA